MGATFILVQRAVEAAADAEAMAQRIVRSISAPYDVGGQAIELGVGVGVAVASEDGRTAEAPLSRSDAALYWAKERRDGYVFARELRTPGVAAPSGQPVIEGPAA
ncbi:diguanylate cyclase [Bradyrhizobium sp. AS23.2]|uniref:diguanylate cyclase domain-containing protein n=1 Tax=Bradyrhizobium sp. AS23.2 TaxID=1680155 RepID=UPI000939469B|nr:diguanylate cyclase [Bradyrhizobium sp. AS23.2]OKO85468.1 hypothetical protein AC630_05925 [Bradyrhizobium sp. AS23.2]